LLEEWLGRFGAHEERHGRAELAVVGWLEDVGDVFIGTRQQQGGAFAQSWAESFVRQVGTRFVE
jgi:hypothetical protein